MIVKDAIKKGQEKYNGILRDLAKSIVTQAVKIGYEKYQTLIHEKGRSNEIGRVVWFDMTYLQCNLKP